MAIEGTHFDPEKAESLVPDIPNRAVLHLVHWLFLKRRATTASTLAYRVGMSLDDVRKVIKGLLATGQLESKTVRLRSFEHGTRRYRGVQLSGESCKYLRAKLEAEKLREALDAGEQPLEE